MIWRCLTRNLSVSPGGSPPPSRRGGPSDYSRPQRRPRAISSARSGRDGATTSRSIGAGSREGAAPGRPRQSAAALLDVERFGARDFARAVGRDLLDPRLGLPQEFLAAPLQGLAPLIDGNRFLQGHLAVLEPLDDGFELLDRAFEGQLFDVDLGVFCHAAFPTPLTLERLPIGSSSPSCRNFGSAANLNLKGDQCGQIVAKPFCTLSVHVCGNDPFNHHPFIRAVTWAATDSLNP